jgi:hypothetical protein
MLHLSTNYKKCEFLFTHNWRSMPCLSDATIAPVSVVKMTEQSTFKRINDLLTRKL